MSIGLRIGRNRNETRMNVLLDPALVRANIADALASTAISDDDIQENSGEEPKCWFLVSTFAHTYCNSLGVIVSKLRRDIRELKLSRSLVCRSLISCQFHYIAYAVLAVRKFGCSRLTEIIVYWWLWIIHSYPKRGQSACMQSSLKSIELGVCDSNS